MAIGAVQIGLVAGAAFLLMRSRRPSSGAVVDEISVTPQGPPYSGRGVFGSGLVLPGAAPAAVDDGLSTTPITTEPPEQDEPPEPPEGDPQGGGAAAAQAAQEARAAAAARAARAAALAQQQRESRERAAAASEQNDQAGARAWTSHAANLQASQNAAALAAAQAAAAAQAELDTAANALPAVGDISIAAGDRANVNRQGVPSFDFPDNPRGAQDWPPVKTWEKTHQLVSWPTAPEAIADAGSLGAYKRFRRYLLDGMRHRYTMQRQLFLARTSAHSEADRTFFPAARRAQKLYAQRMKAAAGAAQHMFSAARTAAGKQLARMSYTLAQFYENESGRFITTRSPAFYANPNGVTNPPP